ncbi:MAG: hypothetical protein ACLUTA_14560 [Blautia wexlerae]
MPIKKIHSGSGVTGVPRRLYHAGSVRALEDLVKRNPHMTAVFVVNYEMTMGAVIGV